MGKKGVKSESEENRINWMESDKYTAGAKAYRGCTTEKISQDFWNRQYIMGFSKSSPIITDNSIIFSIQNEKIENTTNK